MNTLVVDKTGTLTEGAPTVTGIISLKPGGEEALLRVTAAVEKDHSIRWVWQWSTPHVKKDHGAGCQ